MRRRSLLNPNKILDVRHSMSFTGNRSHAIVPGLEPFSEYKLTVHVFNKKGNGPKSDPVTFNTPEGGEVMLCSQALNSPCLDISCSCTHVANCKLQKKKKLLRQHQRISAKLFWISAPPPPPHTHIFNINVCLSCEKYKCLEAFQL